MRKTAKSFIVLILLLIIGSITLRGYFISNNISNNKTLYQIQCQSMTDNRVYYTTSFIKDEKTGCIKFKDEFNFDVTVCGHYTITQLVKIK